MEHRQLRPLMLDLLNFTQSAQQQLLSGLNDTELEVPGTSVQWSARDHIAHLTFWKYRLSHHLDALHRGEKPPDKGDAQVLNAVVFEAQRERSWADILLDAQQAHADLLIAVECFSEDELFRSGWSPPSDGEQGVFSESQPLWGIILGNGFWHVLEHFTQFYLDRNDMLCATELQQAWANKVNQPEIPPLICSIGLATLASFYLSTNRRASASAPLCQALALNPALATFFEQVPDIASLPGE